MFGPRPRGEPDPRSARMPAQRPGPRSGRRITVDSSGRVPMFRLVERGRRARGSRGGRAGPAVRRRRGSGGRAARPRGGRTRAAGPRTPPCPPGFRSSPADGRRSSGRTGEACMSSSRMSPASAKQSSASAPGTAGPSLLAHLWQSIAACRQPGWSRSTWVARVGCSRFSPTASGVKKRNASKWVQRIGWLLHHLVRAGLARGAAAADAGARAAVDHRPLVQAEAAGEDRAGRGRGEQAVDVADALAAACRYDLGVQGHDPVRERSGTTSSRRARPAAGGRRQAGADARVPAAQLGRAGAVVVVQEVLDRRASSPVAGARGGPRSWRRRARRGHGRAGSTSPVAASWSACAQRIQGGTTAPVRRLRRAA